VNVKMIVGILLVGLVASIFFVAPPTFAYLNRTVSGDKLHTQKREQQRNLEHEENFSRLQTQQQERLRIENQEGACNCTQTQTNQRAEECFRSTTGAQEMNMDQVRNQHREGS
jgi:hypothetical protein